MALSEGSDFSDFLLQLYRLASERPIRDFQDAALSLIKPVLPFDSSMWGTATSTPHGIDIHTIHLHDKPPEMLAAYDRLKQHDSAAASLRGLGRATRGFNAEHCFAAPEQGEFLNVLRSFDQENFFITTQHDPRTAFVHWISLFRADAEAYTTDGEERLLARMAPHVMQALALNRVMHLDRLAPPDAPARASAIGDLLGLLHHADPRFEAMLRAEWDDWPGRALPRAVLQHFLLGHERFQGRTVVVAHRVEQGLLFLKARARCRADDLTPRERIVAERMALGETHKQIAQALGRSPATVRNQIQSIYDKLDVRHVAGLIEALRQAD